MKKILWTVFTVFFMLTALCLIASAEEIYQGDELSLTVHIDSYTGIKSGSLEFLYDTDTFEVVEGSWTLSPSPFVSDFKIQDGKGVFLYASPTALGGDIFQVKFRVKETAPLEESTLAVKVRVLNGASESQWIECALGSYQILCRHDFIEQVVSEAYLLSPATCTESAVYYVSCRCGEAGTETFSHGSPLGHAYDHDCDTACNVCGETREITHAYAAEYSKDAENHWQVCTVCGHESEHVQHVSERPCDPVCQVCGGEKPHAHGYEAVVTPPTCTEEGYTTHTCTYCGDSYTDITTAAKGHTPGAAADCLNDRVCTVCGTVLANKLGHGYESVVTDPTCTEEGYTTHTCTRCGDSYTDGVTEATGHTPGDWIVDTEPQVGVEGERHKECGVCHERTETESIPALEETAPETQPQTDPESTPDSDAVTDPESEPASDEVTDPKTETELVDLETEQDTVNAGALGCQSVLAMSGIIPIILLAAVAMLLGKHRRKFE